MTIVWCKNWLNSMIEMVMKDADIVTGPQISKSKNILLRIMENDHVRGQMGLNK